MDLAREHVQGLVHVALKNLWLEMFFPAVDVTAAWFRQAGGTA